MRGPIHKVAADGLLEQLPYRDPVRYGMWDPFALDSFERAQLSHQQRTLVEYLLRALEEGTFLSEHVASAKSVVLALIRAHHALAGHAAIGQPKFTLTSTVLSRSLAEVDEALPIFGNVVAGNFALAQARDTLAGAVAAMASNTLTRPGKAQLASDLLVASKALPHAVRCVVEALWDGAVLDGPMAARIRDEAVALVALSGRNGLALQVELLRLLNGRAADFASVAAVLWPTPRRYRVATVIYGARCLDGVDRLLAGAQQWALTGPNPPAGVPSAELHTLLGPELAVDGSKMLLVLPVDAPDAYAAVNTARRRIVETLDQYSAGQRLLDLAIGRESVALGLDNRRAMTHSRGGGVKLARPLTAHWAEPVRPAMRMASLAGKMDAPVASVMLAWSAIESLGVDASQNVELVAKACALQSIRQQILSVFKSVTAAASARIELARQRVIWTNKPLGEAERALQRVSGIDSPRAREALFNIQAKLPELGIRHSAAEDTARMIEQRMLPHIDAVRRRLLGGGDPSHPMQMSSYTLDLNLFLDAMLPPPAAGIVDPSAAGRDALWALASEAGGLALEQFNVWGQRLADPVVLAEWVDSQQSLFHGLLAWMYASRNLVIHTGEFTVPADVLTAQAARGIVDMVLEFLGYWYKSRNALASPDPPAIEIIRELADRKDLLVGHLSTAVSCHPLNVASITAPDSVCWGRTLS